MKFRWPRAVGRKRARTLVFCTSYAATAAEWQYRYRTWLDAVLCSRLDFDQILMVDDGSPLLPDWPDVAIVRDGEAVPRGRKIILRTFSDHLGRLDLHDFPGWFRSYTFVGPYAKTHGFERIVHVESDAYVISPRMQAYVNAVRNGWVAFWCPCHEIPEAGIQVIAADALPAFLEVCGRPYASYSRDAMEYQLPFTHVEKGLKGDRYGELQLFVPRDADYSAQTPLIAGGEQKHLWWLPGSWPESGDQPAAAFALPPVGADGLRHEGLGYIEFLKACNTFLKPRNYFEIGTELGHSLRAFDCDAVCVDPNFLVEPTDLERSGETLFFRQTSDDFFAQHDLREVLCAPVDLAFLDGLHLYEYLLRDLINTERNCHRRSLLILHDCLPLNARMAEREQRRDESEPADIRDFWTGDVWKILPILKAYRPDLRVHVLDCPPTGLVMCTGLDPASRVLHENYDRIVAEFARWDLGEVGLPAVWNLFPRLDSARLARDPFALASLYAPQ